MTRPASGVWVIGSANLDVVATVDRLPSPGETLLGHAYDEYAGGKGLNQAIAAARSGAATGFVGALGDDDAGAVLRRVLIDDAVDISQVATVSQPTGRAVIFVDAGGENVIVVVPGANSTVTAPAAIADAGVVLAQLEVPIETVTRAFVAARAVGATTILNPAPARDLPDELLEACNIVVPNEHETELLGGVERLRERGVDTVIVTRGGQGVEVHSPTRSWHEPPFEVDVVDTTGAGDAFCGALAARLSAGRPLADAVRWAAAAGALATTVAGAVPAQPWIRDIEALVATRVA
jgi:ribokinase